MYAIVDIETTGGYASANGITDICIYIFDGDNVIDTYQTLINPHQTIPPYIQAMTGITDDMVADAPSFEEVAPKIFEMLEGKVFVAHNVNFDYSFIRAHLAASGLALNTKKLCTVRLSRKILPGLPSYSLGNLCNSLDISISGRHRAYGDAEATVKVFQILLEQDKEQFIIKSLQKSSKEQMLPPNVPKDHFEQLPYTPGVYYFKNEKGKIIYVGKAKNIRYRVNSHFSNNSESRQKQNFLRHTFSISYEPCATELMAHILESTEIKKLWPVFNYSQKRAENVYGIFLYEDQKGYYRLAIERNKKQLKPIHTFHYLVDGHSLLRKLVKEHNLCPKLCFIQHDTAPCEGQREEYCYGACEHKEDVTSYNSRVEAALQGFTTKPSYAIVEQGRNSSEQSCVLMVNGEFYGMGYIPNDVQLTTLDELKDFVTPYKENLFIRNIVNGYAARYPQKVKQFSVIH